MPSIGELVRGGTWLTDEAICYEWTARVTRLESCCSDRGGFWFGFGATGP